MQLVSGTQSWPYPWMVEPSKRTPKPKYGKRWSATSVEIRTLPRVSSCTVVTLLEMTLTSIASYGIQTVSDHTSTKQFEKFDGVRYLVLKHAISLHRLSLNRYMYSLNEPVLFVENLQIWRNFKLSAIPAYSEFISIWERTTGQIIPACIIRGL